MDPWRTVSMLCEFNAKNGNKIGDNYVLSPFIRYNYIYTIYLPVFRGVLNSGRWINMTTRYLKLIATFGNEIMVLLLFIFFS